MNRNWNIFIPENAPQNVVWEMVPIMPRSQCINEHVRPTRKIITHCMLWEATPLGGASYRRCIWFQSCDQSTGLPWAVDEWMRVELFEHIKIQRRQQTPLVRLCNQGDHLPASGGGILFHWVIRGAALLKNYFNCPPPPPPPQLPQGRKVWWAIIQTSSLLLSSRPDFRALKLYNH